MAKETAPETDEVESVTTPEEAAPSSPIENRIREILREEFREELREHRKILLKELREHMKPDSDSYVSIQSIAGIVESAMRKISMEK